MHAYTYTLNWNYTQTHTHVCIFVCVCVLTFAIIWNGNTTLLFFSSNSLVILKVEFCCVLFWKTGKMSKLCKKKNNNNKNVSFCFCSLYKKGRFWKSDFIHNYSLIYNLSYEMHENYFSVLLRIISYTSNGRNYRTTHFFIKFSEYAGQ